MKYFAYLMSAVLLVAAVWYGKQRQYKRSAIFAAFWMAPLVIGISIGNVLSIEQWLCWSFACASLYYAHKLLKENHIGYAFVTFLVATFIFFCGLTSVQTLLKTHLLWQVTSALGSYGEKLDTFQTTVTGIRQSLEQQQTTNEAHQVELTKIQAALRKSISDVASQQNDITNQYQRLTDLNGQLANLQYGITNQFEKLVFLQGDLTTAQTNLLAQQKKVEDVEYWVQNLYGKMLKETFTTADKNRVVYVPQTNGCVLAVMKLSHVPIVGSLRSSVFDAVTRFPVEMLPAVTGSAPDIIALALYKYDTNSLTINVDYVIDARRTNSTPLPKPERVRVEFRSDGAIAYSW